ncbi:unnamed protein product [Didymodactylos carnosus]|uniref:Uncharacterized protein n=1 Tax=Didymodactylos carnosus TaxID=1234261 RepID=A0A816CXX8_9BILA|nr:unnamed protein product [Didymodactylos carnosus]CAF4524743.1 unnamed protein product [Didymodactylos carnosus]
MDFLWRYTEFLGRGDDVRTSRPASKQCEWLEHDVAAEKDEAKGQEPFLKKRLVCVRNNEKIKTRPYLMPVRLLAYLNTLAER